MYHGRNSSKADTYVTQEPLPSVCLDLTPPAETTGAASERTLGSSQMSTAKVAPLPNETVVRRTGGGRCCDVLRSLAAAICIVPLLPIALIVIVVPWLRVPWLAIAARCFPRFLLPFGSAIFQVATAVISLVKARGNPLIMYLRYFKDDYCRGLVAVYGWKPPGVSDVCFMSVSPPGVAPLSFTFEAYRARTYDTLARRDPTQGPGSMSTDPPAGTVLRNDIFPVLVNLDTASPERQRRLEALAEVFLALGQHPPPMELVVPHGVAPSHYARKSSIDQLVGATLFAWLFDAADAFRGETAASRARLKELADANVAIAKYAAGAYGSASQRRRMQAFWDDLEEIASASQSGQQLAQRFGAAGAARIGELLFIAMFAGVGGTGSLVQLTLQHMAEKASERVALFRADPDAYMLEAARHFPPVAGMNPFLEHETRRTTLGNGRTMHATAGERAYTLSSSANMDPTIFDEPRAFRPGRPNAERLLTWNNELGDIRKGTAVRGCPGTFLALRLATQAVAFFAGGIHERQEP